MSSLSTDVEVVGIVGAGVIGASWSALGTASRRLLSWLRRNC